MFDLFDVVERMQNSFDIVAENGNNVEATFDFVERNVRLVAFDSVASTLLLVWTGLNTAVITKPEIVHVVIMCRQAAQQNSHCVLIYCCFI